MFGAFWGTDLWKVLAIHSCIQELSFSVNVKRISVFIEHSGYSTELKAGTKFWKQLRTYTWNSAEIKGVFAQMHLSNETPWCICGRPGCAVLKQWLYSYVIKYYYTHQERRNLRTWDNKERPKSLLAALKTIRHFFASSVRIWKYLGFSLFTWACFFKISCNRRKYLFAIIWSVCRSNFVQCRNLQRNNYYNKERGRTTMYFSWNLNMSDLNKIDLHCVALLNGKKEEALRPKL